MVRCWEWYVGFGSAMSSVVQEGEAARAGGKGREMILFYFFSVLKRGVQLTLSVHSFSVSSCVAMFCLACSPRRDMTLPEGPTVWCLQVEKLH